MEVELSASPWTTRAYAGFCFCSAAIFSSLAHFAPFALAFAAYAVFAGLFVLSLHRVFLTEEGFSVVRWRKQFFVPFEVVESVGGGRFLALKCNAGHRPRRVRFLPEPSHGGFFGSNARLRRQLSDMLAT